MHTDLWPPPVAAADVGWPGSRFVVGLNQRALARSYGRVLLAEVTVVVLALAVGGLALLVSALFFIIAMTAWLARTTVMWLRERDTVLELDTDGIRLPAHRARVGWREITEIRVVPLQGRGGRAENRAVVFLPSDPAAVLGRISARRGRTARRSLARYSSPIAISDRDLDCCAEEIAAAAEILAPPRLRRRGA